MVKSVDTYNDAGEAIPLKEVVVGEDSRAMELTHYVLAERLLQVEYAIITEEHRNGPSSETLVYILEGGFRGFHNMSPGELWSEWKTKEDTWYRMYEDGELPWEVYEEDPIVALEKDETGEVAQG